MWKVEHIFYQATKVIACYMIHGSINIEKLLYSSLEAFVQNIKLRESFFKLILKNESFSKLLVKTSSQKCNLVEVSRSVCVSSTVSR